MRLTRYPVQPDLLPEHVIRALIAQIDSIPETPLPVPPMAEIQHILERVYGEKE